MRVCELIVVEGKDDVAAIKRSLEAEVIATGGYGFNQQLIGVIRSAVKRTGVIIFTDPDSAGNQIRRRINGLVPGCKNAYLAQADGIKGRNIGVENASPEAIRQAIGLACSLKPQIGKGYTLQDLVSLGLGGSPGSSEMRRKVGLVLGLGETNTKQFRKRLNHQGITPTELSEAIAKAVEE